LKKEEGRRRIKKKDQGTRRKKQEAGFLAGSREYGASRGQKAGSNRDQEAGSS
jgi:hypothetical protein